MKNKLLKLYRFFSRIILRRRLKNKDFTLITNTCMGGIIYHELGLRFNTPLINCGIADVDFYKFSLNLKHYMSCELCFISGIATYPTAWCDDVLLYFPHDKSEQVVATKWYERRERINWDNLFFIISDRPEGNRVVTPEDIYSFKQLKCRGKVVFTTQELPDCDYLLKLKKDDEGDYVNQYMLDKTWLGTWQWEKCFDYVYWLNTGELKK